MYYKETRSLYLNSAKYARPWCLYSTQHAQRVTKHQTIIITYDLDSRLVKRPQVQIKLKQQIKLTIKFSDLIIVSFHHLNKSKHLQQQ